MATSARASSSEHISRRSSAAIERALRHIEGNLCERLPLEELAAVAELSVFRFATVFRRSVGVPPHRYICRRRIERAQALLREGMPPAIVASETGFFDQSHLSRHFRSAFGLTPRQYLSQAHGRHACRARSTLPVEIHS
jgi:transcriptional regulator GlxA family with amidase domain